MNKHMKSTKIILITVLTTFFIVVLAIFSFNIFINSNQGKESPQEIQTKHTIKNLEKTKEVVFLNVGVDTVISASNSTQIFGYELPFSKKSSLIVLSYTSKLGIKKSVEISKADGSKTYTIKVPAFEIIGFELDKEEPYKLYDSSGELLSFATEDVDTASLVTERLSTEKQSETLIKYRPLIEESVKEYFTSIFSAIDPEIKIDFEFTE